MYNNYDGQISTFKKIDEGGDEKLLINKNQWSINYNVESVHFTRTIRLQSSQIKRFDWLVGGLYFGQNPATLTTGFSKCCWAYLETLLHMTMGF